MNVAPHAHTIDIRSYDSGSWHIEYGDHTWDTAKPFRWWWDSDEAYNKRCVRRLRMHVEDIIRRHDIATKAAVYGVYNPPKLLVDQWGSEQITE